MRPILTILTNIYQIVIIVYHNSPSFFLPSHKSTAISITIRQLNQPPPMSLPVLKLSRIGGAISQCKFALPVLLIISHLAYICGISYNVDSCTTLDIHAEFPVIVGVMLDLGVIPVPVKGVV